MARRRRRVFGDPDIVLRGLVVGLLRAHAGIFRRRAGRSAGFGAARQADSGKQQAKHDDCKASGHGFLQRSQDNGAWLSVSRPMIGLDA
jgi:hypothetical protein